jgi:hypothetical protein
VHKFRKKNWFSYTVGGCVMMIDGVTKKSWETIYYYMRDSYEEEEHYEEWLEDGRNPNDHIWTHVVRVHNFLMCEKEVS